MLEALQSNSPKDVDENDFIDASRLVYDGVREIRRAVLMNRVSELISNNNVHRMHGCLLWWPIICNPLTSETLVNRSINVSLAATFLWVVFFSIKHSSDNLISISISTIANKDEEELDPEDIEFDEHYTAETRSKCKWIYEHGFFMPFCFLSFLGVLVAAEFRWLGHWYWIRTSWRHDIRNAQ